MRTLTEKNSNDELHLNYYITEVFAKVKLSEVFKTSS